MALLLGKITPKIRQTSEDPKKKQKKQLIILAVVAFLIIAVLLWGFSGGEDPNTEFSLSETVSDAKSSGRGDYIFDPSFYQADRAFLDGAVFKGLKVFGNHPVVTGELGVDNPFVSE